MKRTFLALALCCTLVAPAVQAGQPPHAYARLIETHAPSLVTLKFVMEAPAEFGGGEQEMESPGVMIEKDGLVLTANSQFGGFMGMMGGMTPSIKNIRVLVGDDTKGVEGSLIARDTELDLAWVRITAPDAKGYPHLDLTDSGSAGVGDRVVMLSRMGKFFDRAPVLTEASVGGVTAKPRRLLVPSQFLLQFGMPVFSSEGRLLGITVVQSPTSEEEQADSAATMMGSTDSLRGLILPASEVLSATARAKETAGAAPPAQPAAEPAPATPAPTPPGQPAPPPGR